MKILFQKTKQVGFVCFCLLTLSVLFSSNADGQELSVRRVSDELDQPVYATSAPGDSSRLYVVQKEGQIRVLDLATETINAADFIEVPSVLSSNPELGLLGLAFHPDFQTNRYFYVYFTEDPGGDSQVVRFTATNSDVADPASSFHIIEIEQPQSTHQAGWISFDDEGFLCIATGDGGSSNDNGPGHTPGIGNAQDTTDNLLGKILRIDVDGDDFPADDSKNYAIPGSNPFVGINGDDEIFVYGLRNPWRCSFDRHTGDLYIADVGQGRQEEITVIPGTSNGGQNLGWRLREGIEETPGSVGGPKPEGVVDPIYDYRHGNGAFQGRSITGGYVYRGPVEVLQGSYFFADFVNPNLWSLDFDGSNPASFDGTNFTELVRWDSIVSTNGGSVANVSSFGEDRDGNLYILDFIDGEIFRVEDVLLPGAFGGDVSVAVRNGDLRIGGEDNTDQCIVITATSVAGQFLISSIHEEGRMSTTFNGETSLVVSGVTRDIRVDGKSGRKIIVLTGTNSTDFAAPEDLRVATTGNSSAIILLDNVNVVGRTDISTRNGDDAVVTNDCVFSNRFRVNTGGGDDVFADGEFGFASLCEGELDVRAGGGNDYALCNGSTVTDRASIRMGSGDDGFAVSDCVFGNSRFYGNGGFDRYGEASSVLGARLLRQFENESENVDMIRHDLDSNDVYVEAATFLQILGLGN